MLDANYGPATLQTFTHLGPISLKNYEHAVSEEHGRQLAMLDLRLDRLLSIIDRYDRDYV